MNQGSEVPPNPHEPNPGWGRPPIDEDEIDLADLIRTLWAHRWLIVGVALLVIFGGGTYGVLQEPPYRAETLLAPASGEEEGPSVPGGLGGLASMAGVSVGGGGGQVENALAVLKSRKFLTGFIADRELRPVLFAEKWDSEKQQWDVEAKDDIPTEGDAYQTFKEKVLSASRDEESGLVTLAITWKNRRQTAEWANALVDRLNQKLRQEEIDRLDRRIQYLRAEVDETSVSGVRQALFSIMESELKSQTVAKTQQEYVFRVIDPAYPPAEGDTEGTSLKLILVLSGVLGGFIGIFAAFVREFVRNNFSRPAESAQEGGQS